MEVSNNLLVINSTLWTKHGDNSGYLMLASTGFNSKNIWGYFDFSLLSFGSLYVETKLLTMSIADILILSQFCWSFCRSFVDHLFDLITYHNWLNIKPFIIHKNFRMILFYIILLKYLTKIKFKKYIKF